MSHLFFSSQNITISEMLHLISGFKNLKPHKNLGLYFRWKSGSGGSMVQGLMRKIKKPCHFLHVTSPYH